MIPLSFDQYCRSVKQANVEFILTQPPVQPWWHDFIESPSTAVQFGGDGGASIADGVSSDENYILIGRHYATDTEIIINGSSLGSDDFVLIPPGGRFIFSCNGPRSWLAITVPRSNVEALWSSNAPLRMNMEKRRTCTIPVNPEVKRNVIEHAGALWRFTRHTRDDSRAAETGAHLADLVAKIVSPQNASSPANFDNLRALETACRALAVMRTEDYLGEWYIEDLAAVVGVHPRTLLRACQTVLRMGPVRYLRYRQLNVIRRQLCWGDTSNSVTDVMQSVGISDMGRTAGEYKALFGETPSQTIRRTRQKRIL